jgi:hypothetical protein
MTDEKAESEPTLVDKWIKEQQEWQKTATAYFDSLVKNDDFLVNLGNAMRGSLLAGKPYPGSTPQEPGTAETAAQDDRIDEILHALHRIQGELADLRLTVAELAARLPAAPAAASPPASKTGARGEA